MNKKRFFVYFFTNSRKKQLKSHNYFINESVLYQHDGIIILIIQEGLHAATRSQMYQLWGSVVCK